MIEITTAVVEKVQTLMHENAGFIMSKNVERILDDLAKQAEVFGVSMTSIPVTMKMTISVDDFGVHLTFDSVTWQKTMRASDKACYTVDYDPRQPNLPGFDQADQANQAEKQQPVIDVKALPEHEDDDADYSLENELGHDLFKEVKKANLEQLMRLSEAEQKNVYIWKDKGSVWMIDHGGDPVPLIVPNGVDLLSAMDDDDDAMVVVYSAGISTSSYKRINDLGLAAINIVKSADGEWLVREWSEKAMRESGNPWELKEEFRSGTVESQLVPYLLNVLENDCVILANEDFYKIEITAE